MGWVWVAAALAIGAYGWWVEPEWYRTVRYSVTVNGLKGERALVLLTDLHIGRFSSARHLRRLAGKAVAAAAASNAAAILIGGDFLDYEARYLPRLLAFIGLLSEAGVPLFGVLGNHDYMSFADPSPLIDRLAEAGCTVLRNQAAVLPNGVVLVGADDVETAPGYPLQRKYVNRRTFNEPLTDLEWVRQYDNFHPDLPKVLLSHNPDGVWLPGAMPAVTLAGHTHGGQTFFVDYLARLLPRALFRMLPQGTFGSEAGDKQANGRRVLISRGVGGSAVPFRLGRRPEILVVRLVS